MTHMETPGPVSTRRNNQTFGGVEQNITKTSSVSQPRGKPNPSLCDRHKRATRMTGYVLPIIDDPHQRHALAIVWQVRLTRLERAGLALAALNACDPQDALAVVRGAYAAITGKGAT